MTAHHYFNLLLATCNLRVCYLLLATRLEQLEPASLEAQLAALLHPPPPHLHPCRELQGTRLKG